MIKESDRSWSDEEVSRLRSLALGKNLFYTEIARSLGRKPASVRWKARKLGLPSTQKHLRDRFGKWNSKHSHIRGSAMRYFLTHTREQTRKKFGLTESEIKSLFTVGYRLPEFRHLRKETRLHSPWSAKQLQYLLTHAGLIPRKEILRHVKRGNNVCCIKERLQALGLSSRTLQGITLSQFREAFGKDPEFYLATTAGPDGGAKGTLPTRWKIVPWVWLNEQIKSKKLKAPKEFCLLVETRAMFQEWIFEDNALAKMKRIIRKDHRARGGGPK